MVVHNKFTDPETGDEYVWPLNHEEEGEGGRAASVESSSNVAGTRTIQSQGDLAPIVHQWTGKHLQDSHHTEMIGWQNLCETQTIILTDFAGDQYEGIISSYKYKRVRVALNSRQPDKPWTWAYTLEFTVTRVIAGTLAGSPA
jgi:hypothetical protein